MGFVFGFGFCVFQFCEHGSDSLDPVLWEFLHFVQDVHTLLFIINKILKD